ncbi:MAG: VanW family protein [bacterium]|nr:VanW family protein [bacterium]
MTDQDFKNSDINDDETDAGQTGRIPIVSRKRHSGSAILITSPIVIIALAIIGVAVWLSSSGVDMAWALGTSGWVAPPGSKLAGHDIGGKSFEEISETLGKMNDDFAVVSVWLAEPSFMTSIVQSDFSLTTYGDELVITESPINIGLMLDENSMRREIASLNETAGDLWKFPDRIKMWQEPPAIDAKFMLDEESARNFLTGVKSTVDTEPIDAKLDFSNHQISAAHDGLSLDIDATLQNIPTNLTEIGDIPVELAITHVPPEITNDAFTEIDIENPLASYTTHFATYKRNRSQNISMVAEHFNGVVIQPGEALSFNDTTGPRTFEEGYLAAPMYVSSRVEMSPAGGACQVSTTLFNAALLAGLEIVERYPHSRPCSYVPYGRDATVAYDTGVDLKFRNNLAHAIILNSIVDYTGAGTITFEIFGHPDDRVNVEITNSFSWLGRADPVYISDSSLDPGEEVVEDEGTNGVYQQAWRSWYDADGNKIKTEQISNDRIRSIGALIRRSPSDAPPEEDIPTPPPIEPPSTENPDEPQIFF